MARALILAGLPNGEETGEICSGVLISGVYAVQKHTTKRTARVSGLNAFSFSQEGR
jgi:hypothetical protein